MYQDAIREIVVYTCIVGAYDNLNPLEDEEGVRYVCFTDQPGPLPPPWEARPLQAPEEARTNRLVNRYHKLHPHVLFPEATRSVYIDGNLTFAGSFAAVAKCLDQHGLGFAAFSHPWSPHSLADEVEACIRHGKFTHSDQQAVSRQLAKFDEEGMPRADTIPAGYFLARSHSQPLLAVCMQEWWEQLLGFTGRDQVSLPYALWKSGIPWAFLDRDLGISPVDVTRKPHEHRRSSLARVLRSLRKLAERITDSSAAPRTTR